MKKAIEKIANAFRVSLASSQYLSSSSNFDLVKKLLSLTGGKLSDRDEFVGLYLEKEGHYRVKLDLSTSQIRNTVIALRCIGHTLLHTDGKKEGYFLEEVDSDEFKEATEFALAFLLPKDEILSLKGKQNLPIIAAKYHVPIEFVVERTKDLWKDAKVNMKRYRSIKEVYAEPRQFDEEIRSQMPKSNAKIGDDGYKVVYDDGYISWSPKEAFEKGYIEISE